VAVTNLLLGSEFDSAAELDAVAALSPSRFSHLFVQTTGMLPLEFVRLLKSYRAELKNAVDILDRLDESKS